MKLLVLNKWRSRAKLLNKEALALLLACKDPRVPLYAKIFAVCVVGYAFSPIDLIPDPIPLLGYLDDLVLVPWGVGLATRMIPPVVMAECRVKAESMVGGLKRTFWIAGAVIIGVWIAFFATIAFILWR